MLIFTYQYVFIFQVECPDGPYEYNPIEGAYGSCQYYETRKEIPKEVLQIPYSDIVAHYDHKLVIVASLGQRWHALVPHIPITLLQELTLVQYCVLELIGKGRENVSFLKSYFYLIFSLN